MNYFSVIFVGTILTVWLFGAANFFLSANKEKGRKRLIGIIGASLMACGAVGFFGAGLSSSGAFNSLPLSFEWPTGWSEGVVFTKDYFYVVPHSPSSRVQIYDREMKFLRGWHIESGGGSFKMQITDTNHIHIFTARGNHHYVYALSGQLISSETSAGNGYSSVRSEGRSYFIPTAPWLLIFSSPFLSWLTVAAGLALIAITKQDRPWRRKR